MQLNFNFFNKVFSILISLIPLFMITGGFIPDVILCLSGIYFLFACFKYKLWYYFKNKLIIFFFIFISYLTFRGLFSINSFHTFFTSLVYFRYLFFTLAIIYLIHNFEKFYKYFFLGLCLALVIIIPDTYVQWIFGKNILGWETYGQYRLSGFFRDELIVGAFITKIFILYFVFYIKSEYNKPFLNKFFLPLLIIVNFIVFASGERSAFLHIIIFSILVIIASDKELLIVSKLKIFMIFIILFTSVIFIDGDIKHRMIDHTFNQLKEKTIPFLPYTVHHEEHYRSALTMFKDKPIVGHGSGLFRFLCEDDKYYFNSLSCSTHPHNFYIQLLAENGILGLLIPLIFYLFLIKIFFTQLYQKNFKKEKFNINILISSMGLIVYLWPIIPTMDFFNQWSNIPLFIAFGFFLSNYNYFKSSKIK